MTDNQDLRWLKSSACESGGCLEVAVVGGAVLLRQSGAPDEVLTLSNAEWLTFLAGVKAGDFD